MPDINLVKANRVRVVSIPVQQFTIPTTEAVNAGQAARQDVANGRLTKANASSAAEARVLGIASVQQEAVGLGLTVIRQGLLDGYDLSALAYDAPVYLSDTDGRLSDTPGTTSVVVGRVVSAWAQGVAAAADKILLVDLAGK